eukprot:TRINITY_DN5307_c0_g1_i4.p1 TRINITY_DN5307_c0_g1~~TRINITY_DN5307_c0_g1_i4.p1  ORF type:complete len:139 (+),score=18.73 TRINITY_DN5307_c0_g1_i4:28-417(+)
MTGKKSASPQLPGFESIIHRGVKCKIPRRNAIAIAELGDPAAASFAASAVNTSLVTGRSEITPEIIIGAIAGVIPFIIASIEFGKRIVEQRRCKVCGGSGLELVGRFYRRCTGCGGFLPWQSWRRFFTG